MKKSIVFIVVIGVLLILTALAYTAIYLMTQEARIAEHKIKRIRGFYAAQAGIIHNLELLRRNLDIENIFIGNGIAGYPQGGYKVMVRKFDNQGPNNTDRIVATVEY